MNAIRTRIRMLPLFLHKVLISVLVTMMVDKKVIYILFLFNEADREFMCRSCFVTCKFLCV